MNMDEYQNLCFRTWNQGGTIRDQIINAALGIAGESGEWAEGMKKWLYHSHKQPFTNELGDLLYYIAIEAGLLGVTMEELAYRNVEKLRKRYPDGFSKESSQNREDE